MFYDVMVTVVGNGYTDPSSNPGWGCLHSPLHKYTWEMYESSYG